MTDVIQYLEVDTTLYPLAVVEDALYAGRNDYAAKLVSHTNNKLTIELRFREIPAEKWQDDVLHALNDFKLRHRIHAETHHIKETIVRVALTSALVGRE